MASKFFTNIDLNKNYLVNTAIQNIATGTDPSTPSVGQIYFDTNSAGGNTGYKRLKIYDGSSFISIPYSGNIKNADLTNNTIQIGKIDTSSVTLSSIGAPSTSVGFSNQAQTAVGSIAMTTAGSASGRITNLTDPDQPQDAANKRYVDAVVSGVNVHGPAHVATTGVLGTPATAYTAGTGTPVGVGAYLTVPASSSVLTIDGYALNVSTGVGKRILVKNQGASYLYQNGIYVLDSFPTPSTAKLVRAIDYDNSVPGEVKEGDYVLVIHGDTQAGTAWVETLDSNIEVGVDDIEFTQFSAPTLYTAGNGLSLSGTGLTEFVIDTTITVDKTTAQTLTNKTFTDNVTYFQDNTTNSKKMQFELSGISVSTTRTLTVPDADGTIALTSSNITGSAGSVGHGLTIGTTGLKTTTGSSPWDGSAAATVDIDNTKVPTISGGNTLAFTTSGATSLTVPTSGTLAATSQQFYIGTTQVAINRASASQTLNGVSIDGNAGTVTSGVYTNAANTFTTGPQTVSPTTDVKGIIVKGSSSQSANLQEWQNNSGTALAKVDYSGNVTAASFVKTSGTSSQFLKADGSVDSNTYLTSNQSISLSGDISGTGTTSITTTIGSNKVTSSMLATALNPGGNTAGNLVTIDGTQTLTNKTIGTSQLSGQVAIANGGTNATSASSARTNLAAQTSGSGNALATKYAGSITNDTSGARTISHYLGTRDVTVQVYETSGGNATNQVFTDVAVTGTDTITVTFATQDSAVYRVVVTG